MFITIAVIPLSTKLALRFRVLDIPDKRKVHTQPIPRSGGIAMAFGFFISVIMWGSLSLMMKGILIGSGIIVVFGAIDDLRNLGYKTKFAGQIVAALVVVLYGGVKIKSLGMLLPDDLLLPEWLAIGFTIFVIMGVTNAINLADGLDGLAGGICLLGFIGIGYLAYQCDIFTITLLSVAVLGAIFGFLRFNTRPAVLFMGDAGSQFLGFLAATLSIGLTQCNTPLNTLVPVLIWGLPVLDTVSVMLKRMVQGRPLFSPDKNHLHHDLIRFGLYHTEAVFIIYLIQAFLVTCAILLRFHSEWLLVSGYILFCVMVLSAVSMAHKFHWRFKRYNLVDRIIKGRLKILKDKNILIRVSFRTIYWVTPAVLFFSCVLPKGIPRPVAFFTAAVVFIILSIRFLRKKWAGNVERFALYLLIPFLVYLSETALNPWIDPNLIRLYNFSFVGIVVLAILTLKFSRRRGGFKVTPMDFLIIFVAVAVPHLPGSDFAIHHLGFIAVKIIVLFFTYEVLIAESRGETRFLNIITIASLVVFSIRGLI